MIRLKKIILSLGAIFTVAIASVIGFACFAPKTSIRGGATNNGVGGVVDNLTPKPTTLTFRAGEVSMQKGGDSINYTYSPNESAKSTYAVAYEYCFGNTMDNPMALDLQTINTTSVNLSYVYSPTKLDLTQGVTSNTQYKLQTIPNKNDNLYVYILVSPVEGSSTVNFDSKVTWYFGIAKTITIENNIDNTTTTQTIISGKEVEKDKLETPTAPTGYYFDAWYRDRNYESLVEDTVTTSSKLYARYANLPTDWLELDTTTDTYYVKRGTTALTNITSLTIPSMYNGKKVTYMQAGTSGSQGDGVFYKQGFTSVDIPSTFTTIADYAFDWCFKLTNVKIPNTIQEIGAASFRQCGLTILNIPSSVRYIYNSAFENCNYLVNVVVPEGVRYIGVGVFGYCDRLKTVKLPTTLYDFSSHLFNMSTNLESVDFSRCNKVEGLDPYTFQGCTSLKSVDLSGCTSMSSISNNAFYECTSLKTVILPNSITTIGNYAFYDSGIEYIDLSKTGVTTIGEQAFRFSNLETIIFPDTLTTIKTYAFDNCSFMNSITIPKNVTTIGDNAFLYCSTLVEVYNLSSLDIVAGAYTYGYVGLYAQVVHTSLSEPSRLIIFDNMVYYKTSDTKWISVQYKDKESSSVTFASKTYYIYGLCFINCKITEIVLANGIQYLGSGAFYGCSELIDVDLSKCTQLTAIKVQTFYNCNKLATVKLPNSLQSISNNVFEYCTSLTNINLSECTNLQRLGSQAFIYCTSLTTITLPSSVNMIGKHAFYGCDSLTSLNINASGTWYTTQDESGWNNMTGGSAMTLGTSSENANNFRNATTHYEYYWYKI